MKYVSTDTVIKSYGQLIKEEFKNPSILHIFLILKGCGYDNISQKKIELISEKGYPTAYNLSMLFSYSENKPSKYEFINPFSMKEWGLQSPSESLKKWVSSRIKNNIIGGATTWRKIIKEDIYTNELKFTFNYVNEIKHLTIPNSKINLFALAVWYSRFIEFDKVITPLELIKYFVKIFNLDENELNTLFDTKITFDLDFIDSMHDTRKIRNIIGRHPSGPEIWENTENFKNEESVIEIESSFKLFKTINMNVVTVEKIKKLLEKYYQLILSGPPGTTKSFLANQIATIFIKEYGESSVVKIQFHPQYTYQDFIGGFIVNGDKVESNRGVFLKLIDTCKLNPNKKYLLIIDELNRANVSSVFGETIQCLDRGYIANINIGGLQEVFSIPNNLFIIGTMNTTDRTLGTIDFAIKRRFTDIYVGVNESELLNNTILKCGISSKDLLTKINDNLKKTLKNNEFVIGQTIFYSNSEISNGMFVWNDIELEDLFNYKILPIVEDYCNKDSNKIIEVVGEELIKRVSGQEFINALSSFLS